MQLERPSFVDRVSFARGRQVVLFKSTANGKPFFAYILCDIDGYQKIMSDYKSQTKNHPFNTCGEVLYLDFIAAPDEKALEFLQDWQKRNG